MKRHLIFIAINILFGQTSFAQTTTPSLSVQESVERLQEWISPSHDGDRNYNKDRWVEKALKVLDTNYDHPQVQNFVKNGDSVERMIRVCGSPCKHILLVGLVSSDKKAVEKTRGILKEVLATKDIGDVKDGSVANDALKSYRVFVAEFGNKDILSDPKKLLASQVDSFSNIFMGEQFFITPENQYAYLRLRAKLYSELSVIQDNKPISEVEYLKRWYIADSEVATREQLRTALKSLKVSDKEIEALSTERSKAFARRQSCQAFRLNWQSKKSTLWSDFAEALALPGQKTWTPSEGNFSDQVKTYLESNPGRIDKAVEEWPKLIVAALGSTTDPSQIVQLRILTSIGAQACRKNAEGEPDPSGPRPRCNGGCGSEDCRAWTLLESDLTTIQAEAKNMKPYLDSIDPSKILQSEGIKYEIAQQERSIVNMKKVMDNDIAFGRPTESFQSTLDFNKRELEQMRNELSPKDVSACMRRELATQSGKFEGTTKPAGSNGL